jgi:hypothetical protein
LDTSVPKHGEGHVKASPVTPENNRNEAHAKVNVRHDESSSTNQSSRSIPSIEEETIAQMPEGSDSTQLKKRWPASNQDLTEMINDAMGMP